VVVLSILGLFEAIVSGVLGLLPSPTVPGLNSLATTVVGESWFNGLGWVNNYLPLTDILSAFGIVLAVWGAVWIVKVILWLLGKFHVTGAGE